MYNYNEMIKMGFITRDENTMINEETNQIAITYGTQNLVKINDSLRKASGIPAKPLCVIYGLTNTAYKRKDGVYVAPIPSLKP